MNHIEASEKKWRRIQEEFPILAMEVNHLSMTDEEYVLLKMIYAGFDYHDLPSVAPERALEYVRASVTARNELFYVQNVPEKLFYDYVLPPRVNNEFLDGSRTWLYEQIRARVQGKPMLDAALEVNYWCCERATYQSSDDRTIAPFGMCNRTRGRCGEESTLLVCALRAVGIPARQVYVPHWSHCDDNHAWVEFWADGQWHYMGACEPEPVPDRGWFDSAASRAMLVRSRVPDFRAEAGYRVVNSTARYADTACLKVIVRKNHQPVSDVQVCFQIINENRLVTLHREKTDEQGITEYEFGIGSLVVSAYFDNRLTESQIDLRSCREVVLDWESGFDPLTEEWTQQWELVPPPEKLPPYVTENEEHRVRLHNCDGIRKMYEKTPKEIEKFRNLEGYPAEDKETLLSALSEKDMYDVTSEVLEDYLMAARPWKNCCSRELWEKEILAPRVELEMLQPVRMGLQKYFANEYFLSVEDVFAWMKKNLRKLPEYGLTDRRGNALGYVRHRVCPESEWEILAVQICRAVGIPAKLRCNAWNGDRKLTVNTDEKQCSGESFSLSRWESGNYRRVDLQEKMPAGSYCLVTSRRQIDGTVSAVVKRFVLNADREVEAVIPPDQTWSKLKKIPISAPAGKPSLMIFLDPGAEPTEHLLLELLELKDAYNGGNWPVRLLVRTNEDNKTFTEVLKSITGCILEKYEYFDHYRIRTVMGVGDARLPLAVVLDKEGNGVYACANYNIGTGNRLFQILRMIS